MPLYATVDDYTDYMGVALPYDIPPRIMAEASRAIDKALVGAIYHTDEDGFPVDQVLRDALRDAACAQARPAVECLDPCKEQWKMQMKLKYPSMFFPHLTVEAFDILREVRLLPITLIMRG